MDKNRKGAPLANHGKTTKHHVNMRNLFAGTKQATVVSLFKKQRTPQ
jgi:hypothetical protein